MWTLVLGILLAISEILGSVKRGPNGILHAVWKFYNLKVELEYDDDEYVDEAEHRVNETVDQPDRETIVMEKSKVDGVVSPNVLLINK